MCPPVRNKYIDHIQMHDIGLLSVKLFIETYCKQHDNIVVVDIGGIDENRTLRTFFESIGMKYICVDIKNHPCVDVVTKPCGELPFQTGSVDIVVSTSCFEHDPCFWITFKEMCRIVKTNGYIYVTVPSLAMYHACPGDNWRFYYDAGQALAYWSGINYGNILPYPVKVLESFHMVSVKGSWEDYVCIWQRNNISDLGIESRNESKTQSGDLENLLIKNGIEVLKGMNAQ